MKKRILSIFLVMVILLTAFPITSSATDLSLAEVADLINTATFYASQASYNWERDGHFTKNIDATLLGGSAISILDSIIKTYDENSTVDSVVYNYMGGGIKNSKVIDGAFENSDVYYNNNYLLKAMNINALDIKNYYVFGNEHTITLTNCSNPQRNGNSSLCHTTDDFITTNEVKSDVATVTNAITVEDSSGLNYSSIKIKAVIEDGLLTNLEISHSLDAIIKMRVALAVTATGGFETINKYSNFDYSNVADLPEMPDEPEISDETLSMHKDVAKLINNATSYASRSSYEITKIGEYIDPVDFGDATVAMDRMWQMLSEDWTNYKVFSGLFDIGCQTANVTDGIDSDNTYIYEKYFIKSTKLKETDIKSVVKNGNSYTVQLVNCNNPQKDNRNALNHATDYFVTGDDIRSYFSAMLGSMIKLEQENFYFSSIILEFDVDKEIITNLKISYKLDAVMQTNLGTGTLSAKYVIIYSDLDYDNVDLPETTLKGWINENGKWAYYENGVKVTNMWLMDSVGWCYIGADGYKVTNEWLQDSRGWCYVDNNGYMVTNQWIDDGIGLKYVGADGYAKVNCWGNDSVGSYYFGEDGYIYKDAWFIVDNTYNYVNEEGYCDIKFTFEFVSGTQKDVAITDYTGNELKVVIPSTIGEFTVVSIGNSAFSSASRLISVEIPDTVTVIGQYAFSFCTGLTKVVLPEGLITIQYGAFNYCTGLINIKIPDSVTGIGGYAFAYCSSLEEINIPSGITYIYKDTFRSCSKLARVIIPKNVEIIDEYAFGHCSSLVDVWLPVSIDVICKNAFSYSNAFSTVYYAGTETEWNNITIADNKILNSVQIHYNVPVETIDCHWTEYTFDATCTEDGEFGYECPCGYKTSTTISAIGHDYETDFTIDVEATATTDGIKSRHCKNCDVTTDVTVIPATGIIKNGWVLEGSKWAYYQNNVKVTNKWLMDSVGWCFVGEDGYCVTNCWKADSKGWCYLDSNGRMVINNWVLDNGKWYFMDANGYMVSNQWRKDSKGWCYLGSSGAMLTNSWVKDSAGWCYVGADGYCVTNKWVKDSKGWCYLDAQGRMVYNKWVKDSKGWCYVGSSGYMVTSQWVQDGGKWYYLDASGYMVTGTKVINGKTYKFNSSGVWIG